MPFDRSTIGKTSYNNCLTWALWQWIQHGGYLMFRWAGKRQQLWWPHAMWLPSLKDRPLHFTKRNINYPWPLFKGFIKEGDWLENQGTKRKPRD